MNKSDLIKTLTTQKNLTEMRAAEIVNMIFDRFADTLKKGNKIEIRGFGNFTIREYGAFTGKNPRSGAKIHVKAKKLPFFRAGKDLKERVNKG